jgi:hypothetical protein
MGAVGFRSKAVCQSCISFNFKSNGQGLAEIERAFGFKINPPPSKTMRASQVLLWQLQIGKRNPCSTRALAKLQGLEFPSSFSLSKRGLGR